MASKAQTEALKWLLAKQRTAMIPANALMVLYEERFTADKDNAFDGKFYIGTNRRHAWRRTSGRVLAKMRDDGLLTYDGWDRYSPRFQFTKAGFEAARA